MWNVHCLIGRVANGLPECILWIPFHRGDKRPADLHSQTQCIVKISDNRAHTTKSLSAHRLKRGAQALAGVPMPEGEPIEINSISLEIIMMEQRRLGNFLPVAPSAKTVNETLLDFEWWRCVRSLPSAANSQLPNLLWLLNVKVCSRACACVRRLSPGSWRQCEATLVLCILLEYGNEGSPHGSRPTHCHYFRLKIIAMNGATHCVWKFLMRKCPKMKFNNGNNFD